MLKVKLAIKDAIVCFWDKWGVLIALIACVLMVFTVLLWANLNFLKSAW